MTSLQEAETEVGAYASSKRTNCRDIGLCLFWSISTQELDPSLNILEPRWLEPKWLRIVSKNIGMNFLEILIDRNSNLLILDAEAISHVSYNPSLKSKSGS